MLGIDGKTSAKVFIFTESEFGCYFFPINIAVLNVKNLVSYLPRYGGTKNRYKNESATAWSCIIPLSDS